MTALNGHGPDAVSTFPSTAALLAEEQLAGRLHIAPAVVAVGAEVLTVDMRRIRAAWNVEPHQAYLAAITRELRKASAIPSAIIIVPVPEIARQVGRAAGFNLIENNAC